MKTIPGGWLFGSLALVCCTHGERALAQRPSRGACEINCGSSSTRSAPDPAAGALMQMMEVQRQNRARRDAIDAEREERRAALEAQWDREAKAAAPLWQAQRESHERRQAEKNREHVAAVDRMIARQIAADLPLFLSRETRQDVVLGYDRPQDAAGGFSVLKDQNGNAVGSYVLATRRSADGKYLDVQITVTNRSACTMHFNGYFKKGDTPYDLLDWGSGAQLDAGGSRTITDRIVIGGGSAPADIHRFTPDAGFSACAERG